MTLIADLIDGKNEPTDKQTQLPIIKQKTREKLLVNLLYLTTSKTKGTYLASLKISMPGTDTVYALEI